MAGISKAERERRAAEAAGEAPKTPQEAQPIDDGLIAVVKGREVLRIHPSTLKSHEAAGWVKE